MAKTKNKSKAPKNVSIKQNGFFRALIIGVLVSLLCWIILSLILAFVMSRMKDSNSLGPIFSVIVPILSLLFGGFASGKADKSCAVLTSLVLGSAFLGIGYAVSSLLDLSKGMGSIMKSVVILVVLVSPLLGARFSLYDSRTKRRGRKRL